MFVKAKLHKPVAPLPVKSHELHVYHPIKFCGKISKISGKAIIGIFRDHGNDFIILEYLRWTAKISSYGVGGGRENGVKIALLEL